MSMRLLHACRIESRWSVPPVPIAGGLTRRTIEPPKSSGQVRPATATFWGSRCHGVSPGCFLVQGPPSRLRHLLCAGAQHSPVKGQDRDHGRGAVPPHRRTACTTGFGWRQLRCSGNASPRCRTRTRPSARVRNIVSTSARLVCARVSLAASLRDPRRVGSPRPTAHIIGLQLRAYVSAISGPAFAKIVDTRVARAVGVEFRAVTDDHHASRLTAASAPGRTLPTPSHGHNPHEGFSAHRPRAPRCPCRSHMNRSGSRHRRQRVGLFIFPTALAESHRPIETTPQKLACHAPAICSEVAAQRAALVCSPAVLLGAVCRGPGRADMAQVPTSPRSATLTISARLKRFDRTL